MQFGLPFEANVNVINVSGHPFRTSKPGDVGHDLHVVVKKQSLIERAVSWLLQESVLIVWPFRSKLAPSSVRLEMTDGIWCHIVGRSSTSRKHLMVLGGIIDSGYRGELFAVLANYSFVPRILKDGERYAQVIFFQASRPFLNDVYWFESSSVRGTSGFGSSGR